MSRIWYRRPVRHSFLQAALLLALALLRPATALASPAAATPAFDTGPVRGITVSTHTSGREWGSEAMAPTLRRIRDLGANWVTIHPYGAIGADGSVRFWDGFDPDRPPEYLARPIREAHALGLKILIKPHLAYWGSPFRWRGDITFDEPAAWERFWRDYERWIVALARASRQADAFVVGTELDRTLGHEAEWRRLIAAVRRATPAPLTYAANWSDYERVGFWDALDLIGIQAYFPVAGRPSPPEAELMQGWQAVLGRLRAYSERHGRPVVFTELGYNRSFTAAVRPWEYATDGAEAEAVQERCLRVALEAIEAEPRVVGAFLWKWFPEPHPVGRNFQLATPGLEAVIRGVWRRAAPVQGTPR